MSLREPIWRPDGPPVNIVLLGPPAGGKGTQAGYLAERYGMVHVSTGDLLRARAKFLPSLQSYLREGRLVPDNVVVDVLKERLADSDCLRGVLLDGFPRTRAQAEALQRAGVEISAVIHLEVADDVVVQRIGGRRIDPWSGKIYHVKDNPPPSDVRDRVIQREDDTPEKIRERLVTYHQERDAILEVCGDRVRTIHVGTGPHALPADVRSRVVFDEVRKALEGDMYWGALIRSTLVAKAFECGSSARTLVSTARFFQHSRYRLLQKGCLADAAACCRVLLRSQNLQLLGDLQPLVEYELRTWLEEVQAEYVVVGHSISQKSESGDVVVARAWATLKFLEGSKCVQVPEAAQLQELAVPSLLPPRRVGKVWDPPAVAWRHETVVSSVDLDLHGRVHEAACLAQMDRWRFLAAKSNGYPHELQDIILSARTSEAHVSYLGFVGAGDRISVLSWLPEEEGLVVAFEVLDEGSKPVLRGYMLLTPQETSRL